MKNLLWVTLVIAGCAQAQVAVPAASDTGPKPASAVAEGRHAGKVGLVRGVVKQVDPIHDQLLIHVFGGHNVRIGFDPRTQLFLENKVTSLNSILVGSVVSIDTVIDGGKMFALSVRTGRYDAAELNGQILRYDAAKSQIILRDPVSPESVSLRIAPSTLIVNQGKPASPLVLSPGMLVRVSFSPAHSAAKSIEILAAPGAFFTFQGRIVSVDLSTRVMALLNDSDQSVRELAIGSLDASTLRLLREGADVDLQADFDGNQYNVRTVTLLRNQ
ncbi:MAG: hypothetical protein WBW53_08140 [Terriglobales bacterium]